jgi:hypothetical protein
MNYNKSALAVAVAATLGGASTAANATVHTAVLTGVTTYSTNGSAAGNITSSTATFEYDDVTTVLTQTGGTYNARFTTAPTNTIYRHLLTGAVVGNNAAAAATTFDCVEGNFGGNVGASICGNYGFGGNFANDSTASWGPGTAFARTLGGDDVSYGPQQSIASYNGWANISWLGTTLTLGKTNLALTSGQTWNLSIATIPVPAAVWLFGSALGLLGVAGRRKALA